jgi:hypothetical protein
VGAVDALQETPAELKHMQLLVGGVGAGKVLNVSSTLRSTPPDYIECADISNASSCRGFDANGFPLHAKVEVAAVEQSLSMRVAKGGVRVPDQINVQLLIEGPARAEVTLVEKSNELVGPLSMHEPASQ